MDIILGQPSKQWTILWIILQKKKDTGKNIGDDFKLGKITLPIILAWDKSNKSEKEFWIRTLKILKQKEEDLDDAKDIIKKYNIISECQLIAKKFIDISIKSLKEFPNSKYKSSLINLANSSLKRTKQFYEK